MLFNYEMKPSVELIKPFYWFVFSENELLIQKNETNASIPLVADITELKLNPIQKQYFGTLDEHPCFYVEVTPGKGLSKEMAFSGLRQLYGVLDEDLFWVASRALQLLNWDNQSRYCGKCGTPTELNVKEKAKKCTQCGLLHFPRISPAIIVGIVKDNKILLANGTRFQSKIFSVLAGFVEPGESLEECIQREVKEEVGIEVDNIRYFDSQPWPFPDSLMIGFLADYADGTIAIDETEIKEAGWFTADQLPQIPGKISIARKIIDWFVDNY